MALLAGLAIATPAIAAPNWLGQTGLLLTPTADALDARQVNVAFHHITDVANLAAGNVGLTRGLEVGVLFFDPQRGNREGKFTGSAKYQVLRETPNGIGIAVGWWDFADELNSTLYGVASKKITNINGFPLRVHVGGGGGIYDNVFAGAELPLATNLNTMVEFDGTYLNGGVRWGVAQGFRIDLGFLEKQFGVGASYNSHF